MNQVYVFWNDRFNDCDGREVFSNRSEAEKFINEKRAEFAKHDDEKDYDPIGIILEGRELKAESIEVIHVCQLKEKYYAKSIR